MEHLTIDKLDKCSIWDEYAPIKKVGNIINIYFTDSIEAPSVYNEVVFTINNAQPHELIHLHINNGGGWIDSCFMIIDAIEKSQAKVIGYLYGTVASVATIIALSCDYIVPSKYISFMIHNYSAGAGQQKGHELKAYQNFTDKELNRAFREIYKGFLTDEEMTNVIEGKDIWLNEDEVMERWSKRVNKE